MKFHTRQYALAATVYGVAALCGCGHKRDTTHDAPYADVVATMVPQIEASTGLTFKRPPVLQTRSKAQVRDFLLAAIADTLARRELRGSAAAYKLLGMLPDTLNLEQLLVNLLTEQVVGFYDPKTKVLYVVDGAPRDMAAMTVTHELVHALQDQYVNLDSLQFLRGNDRKMAAQAVFEGEALYEQFAANGVELNVPGGWNRVRVMMRKSQTAMPIFAAAPPLIRETLLFPYLDGAEFIKTYKARRGHAVPFSDMPQSTEQILHPATAYFGTRDAPTAVSFAPLTSAGMTPLFDDDLGEFETSIFAFGLPADSAPRQLAEGWDGDHYLLFATPQGNALAWASVWDSPAQAHRVQVALERRIAERNAREATARPARSRTLTAGTVAGRPVLLYLDLPAGVDGSVISLSSIRLGPQ